MVYRFRLNACDAGQELYVYFLCLISGIFTAFHRLYYDNSSADTCLVSLSTVVCVISTLFGVIDYLSS